MLCAGQKGLYRLVNEYIIIFIINIFFIIIIVSKKFKIIITIEIFIVHLDLTTILGGIGYRKIEDRIVHDY